MERSDGAGRGCPAPSHLSSVSVTLWFLPISSVLSPSGCFLRFLCFLSGSSCFHPPFFSITLPITSLSLHPLSICHSLSVFSPFWLRILPPPLCLSDSVAPQYGSGEGADHEISHDVLFHFCLFFCPNSVFIFVSFSN